MAKVALRAYLREIENLIERGQTNQAIAHCKYILKQFPKHVDTYRLLAKTYLESQRYTEAADIFQRVLAVIPDDFLAHLGMSIIREDEGNLDASIWHMERAFEVQPSNSAIQDELRRLYGRRDGVEPPRVRLTRGALVRMYARGELYPQSIAEARAALAEDPTRIDIEVMLARIYSQSGQKVEATDLAGRLINRLPFSLDANQILASVLPGTQRAEDAKAFQRNLNSIDPYAAFLSEATPRSDLVPENAVMVEHLDYDEDHAGADQPDWAKTVGIDLEAALPEVPDWIGTVSGTAPSVGQQAEEQLKGTHPFEELSVLEESSDFPEEEPPVDSTETTKPVNVIPEWMREAGWGESSGTVDESKVRFEEMSVENEEIAPADIPEWLKDLSPESEEETPLEEESERLAMLDQLLPSSDVGPREPAELSDIQIQTPPIEMPETTAPTDLFTTGEDVIKEQSSSEDQEDVPDWLASLTSEPAEEEPATTGETDWLNQLQEELPAQPEETRGTEGNIPDWMEPTVMSGTIEESISREVPKDWISEGEGNEAFLEESGISNVESSNQPAVPEGQLDLPDWLKELEGSEVEAPFETGSEVVKTVEEQVVPSQEEVEQMGQHVPESPTAEGEMDVDSAMAWLESLAARQGAEPEELVTKPEERPETPPDWLLELANEEEEPEPAPDAQTLKVEQVKTPYAEISELEISEELQPESPEFNRETELPSDTLLLPEEEAEGEDQMQAEAAEAIGALSFEIPLESSEAIEQPAQDLADISSGNDMDAAMAWLESLALRQGADSEGLLSQPDERTETPPDWIQEAMTGEDATQLPTPEAGPIPADADLEAALPHAMADIPEEPAHTEQTWFEELAQSEGTSIDTSGEQEGMAQVFEVPAPDQTGEEGTPAAELEQQPVEKLPDWLETLAGEPEGEIVQGEAEAAISEISEEPAPVGENVPEVLGSLIEESEVAEPSEEEPIPDWLETLIQEESGVQPPESAAAVEAELEEAFAREISSLENETPMEPAETLEEDKRVAEPVEQVEPSGWILESQEEATEIPPDIQTGESMAEASSEEIISEVSEGQAVEAPMVEERSAALSQPGEAGEWTRFEAGKNALLNGKIDQGLDEYSRLVEEGQLLDEVVEDLRSALYRYPVDISLWQLLGDAYLRQNKIQDALDSYTKAEELLR